MKATDRWPATPPVRWTDAGAPRSAQPRSLRTRRAIMLAAAQVIEEDGYHGASVDDIIARHGGTKGGLYFHFASKHALAEAVVAEVFAAWHDLVERIDLLELDPLQTLLMYYDAYTSRLMHDTTARAALRIVQDDVGRHHAASWSGAWEELVEGVLRRASAQGLLRAGVDPGWLSRHLLATVTGHSQLATARAEPSMWDRMNDMWSGLLPVVATPCWLDSWLASGWASRERSGTEETPG